PVGAPTSYDRPLDGGGFALEALAASAPSALWSAAPGGFASLRFIGQIFDGYLVCEGDGRVVLIDQHAAHERVAFERLRAERSRRSPATASCGSVSGSIRPRCTRSSRRWTGWTSPRTVRTGAPSR